MIPKFAKTPEQEIKNRIFNLKLKIKKAAKLSEKTFAYIQENLRPGISEMEFCGEFETFARKSGHSGSVLTRHYRAEGYPFHFLSGKSGGLAGVVDTPCCGTGTSIAHPFGAGPKIIEKNEFAAGIESVIQITEKDACFLSTTAHEIFSC